MEGFSDTYSYFELEKSRVFYAKSNGISEQEGNVFLIEGASRTHPKEEILPETNLQFSFYNLIFDFIFFGEQFQHTLRNKNPSGTVLPFSFDFIFFGEGCLVHTLRKKSFQRQFSPSFFQFHIFKRSCSVGTIHTLKNPSEWLFFFFIRRNNGR